MDEIDNGLEELFDEYFAGGGSGSGGGNNGDPTDEDILNLLDELDYGQRGNRNWNNSSKTPELMQDQDVIDYNTLVREQNKKINQQWSNYFNANSTPVPPPYSYMDANQQMKPAVMSDTGVFLDELGREVGPKAFTKNREKPIDFMKPIKQSVGYREERSSGSVSAGKSNKPNDGRSNSEKRIPINITTSEDINKKENSTTYNINPMNESADHSMRAANSDIPELMGTSRENLSMKHDGNEVHYSQFMKAMLDEIAELGAAGGNLSDDGYKEMAKKWGIKINNPDDLAWFKSQVTGVVMTSKDILQKDKNGTWKFGYAIPTSDLPPGQTTKKAPYTTRQIDANGNIIGEYEVWYQLPDSSSISRPQKITLKSKYSRDGRYIGSAATGEYANWNDPASIKKAILIANGYTDEASHPQINVKFEIKPTGQNMNAMYTGLESLTTRIANDQKLLHTKSTRRSQFAPEQFNTGYKTLGTSYARSAFAFWQGIKY